MTNKFTVIKMINKSSSTKASEAKNIKESLIKGYLSFLDGDLEQAKRIYLDIYKKFPDSQLILYNLILTYLRKGEIEEAKKVLYEFFERKKMTLERTKHRIVRNMFVLNLLLHILSGEVTRAIGLIREQMYEELFIIPPDWEYVPNIELDLAKIFSVDEEEIGRLQRIFLFPKKSEYVFPIDSRVRLIMYRRLSTLAKTREFNLFTRGILAILAASINRFKEAREFLNLAKNESSDIEVILLRGKIKYVLGDLNGAYRDFLDAVKLIKEKSKQFIPLANLSVIYLVSGDHDKAIEKINEALKIRADCYTCWYIRALTLLYAEKWREAEQAFKAILEWKKDDPRIWFGLGLTKIARGKVLDGIEAMIRAIKLDPMNDSYVFYLNLARRMSEK